MAGSARRRAGSPSALGSHGLAHRQLRRSDDRRQRWRWVPARGWRLQAVARRGAKPRGRRRGSLWRVRRRVRDSPAGVRGARWVRRALLHGVRRRRSVLPRAARGVDVFVRSDGTGETRRQREPGRRERRGGVLRPAQSRMGMAEEHTCPLAGRHVAHDVLACRVRVLRGPRARMGMRSRQAGRDVEPAVDVAEAAPHPVGPDDLPGRHPDGDDAALVAREAR